MQGLDEEPNEFRRKDDAFIRRVAVVVLSAVIVQAFVAIYFAGAVVHQVNANTNALLKFQDLDRRLTRMEVSLENIAERLDRDRTRGYNKEGWK